MGQPGEQVRIMRAVQLMSIAGGLRERAAVAALAAAHAILGLALLPEPMFSKYPDAARLVLAGQLRVEEGADFSPLYLLLNTAIPAGPLRWLQSVVGAGCAVGVFLVARRLFGRAPAFIAMALFAAAVPVLAYEATLEPDVWVMGLGTLAIALLMAPKDAPRLRACLGAGAALGLCAAARPSALPFVAIAGLWLLAREQGSGAPRPWLKATATVGCAAALSLLPPLVLRTVVGQALGGTMSAGAVFHHGNRPEGTGLGAQPPLLLKQLELQLRSPQNPDPVHALYRRFARASEGAELTAAQTEAFWARKVAAFASREPGAFLALLLRKLAFFVLGPDGHDLGEVRVAAVRLEGLPLVRTQWLGVLGTVGLVLLLASRKKVGLLAFSVGIHSLMALCFYVVSRYRVATVPAWCVLGAGLLALVRDNVRAPPRLGVGAAALAAAALVALLAAPIRDGARMLERAGTASGLAATMDEQRAAGQLAEATRTFIQLQGTQPFVLLTRDLRGIGFEQKELTRASVAYSAATFGVEAPADAFQLAVLRARAGECAQLGPSLEQLETTGFRSAIFDLSLDPALLVAQCALESADLASARRAIARSLERRPGSLDALALAVAGGAGAAAEEELFALHDRLSARFALARARLAFGDPAGALADTDAVLLALPEAGVVHYERARALLALGDTTAATEAYGRALQLFPTHAFAGAPFEAAVAARLLQAPGDAAAIRLAAEHRLRAGDVAGARALSEGLQERSAPTRE